jgi:hypothetical protein
VDMLSSLILQVVKKMAIFIWTNQVQFRTISWMPIYVHIFFHFVFSIFLFCLYFCKLCVSFCY